MQHVHDQILLAAGVEQPEPHRQAQLVRLEREAQRRQLHRAVGVALHFVDVDLGDEELHLVAHVRRQRRARALRDGVVALAQPLVEHRLLVGVERSRARQLDDDALAERLMPPLLLDDLFDRFSVGSERTFFVFFELPEAAAVV